jgi:hypothetical protein
MRTNPDPTYSASESQPVEAIGPSLHLGAFNATRGTRLGPAWAALCGVIASTTFAFNGASLLLVAFILILADWVWPALWTMLVRTDWRAPIARWPETPTAPHAVRLPYLRSGSPGDRWLAWAARVRLWWRSSLMPMTDVSVPSSIAALSIALVLSIAAGWRALALTLAMLALTLIGMLRALRFRYDSDGLRAMVYGTLPWWLGHAAFASLTLESAGLGLLFGWAYRGLMAQSAWPGLLMPQIAAATILFGGAQPEAALIVLIAVVAQAALRSFLTANAYARRAQIWVMLAMLSGAAALQAAASLPD